MHSNTHSNPGGAAAVNNAGDPAQDHIPAWTADEERVWDADEQAPAWKSDDQKEI